MSATLTLAGPSHAAALLPMVAAYHAEDGFQTTDAERETALLPLLEGSPHGVAYLIGPERAPVGYIVICFGWSLEFGGLDGFVDEIYLRRAVRGRGIGGEVLRTLPKALAEAGLRALHLEVAEDNPRAAQLYARAGFVPREGFKMMTRRF